MNPKTQQKTTTTRTELKVDTELPLGSEYGDMVLSFLNVDTVKE